MTVQKANLKILYGYPWYESDAYGNVQDIALAYIRKLNGAGFDVEGFCLTLDPPGPCLTFRELDSRWRRGDKNLLFMYEMLLEKLEGKDVLINAAGINLHPEFVETLPVVTIYQCFDDPENSHNLSKPVAASYDLCLVGNIAEVETYHQWGVQNAEWCPMGIWPEFINPDVTFESIITGKRDIDLFMMIDRLFPYRRSRIDCLANAFPNGHFYGRGWSRGYLPSRLQLDYLQRSKIGPNIHNSTGPINARTFYLPANGVLQICDNKSHLGKIFELGKEVIGFDNIRECIDLCRYYLAHDEARRIVAANGWQRAVTDYNELAVFSRVVKLITELDSARKSVHNSPPITLDNHKFKTRHRRMLYDIISPLIKLIDVLFLLLLKAKSCLQKEK